MISTKGRYALRVMIDLALYSNGDYIALRDIAARQEVSLKYLEQVIALLNKAGLLRSMRGNSGGYMLARPLSDYTAGDIIRAAEGTLAPVTCLKGKVNGCQRKESCYTLAFWEKYYKTVTDFMDGITLEDLAEEARGIKKNSEVTGNKI